MCKHLHNVPESDCFVCNGKQAAVRTIANEAITRLEAEGFFEGKETKIPRAGSEMDLVLQIATRQEGTGVIVSGTFAPFQKGK